MSSGDEKDIQMAAPEEPDPSTTLMTLDEIGALNPQLSTSKIRVDEDTQKVSVLDLIRMVTGLSSSNALNTFRRLGTELATKCSQLRINGKGKPTPVCDAQTAVEIVWELPGKAAKAFRRVCAHYICRILGGDATLIGEMEARYLKTSEKQRRLFTANLPDPNLDRETLERSRRARERLDREHDEMALEERRALVAERRALVAERRAKTRLLELEYTSRAQEMMTDIEKFKDKDVFFYSALKDSIINGVTTTMTTATPAAITEGPGTGSRREYARCLSSIVRDLGFGVQTSTTLSAIGKQVAAKWRAMHPRNEAPTQERLVNGAMLDVKVYPAHFEDTIAEIAGKYLDSPAVSEARTRRGRKRAREDEGSSEHGRLAKSKYFRRVVVNDDDDDASR